MALTNFFSLLLFLDFGDVTLTLPNSPKVNLHNNNNMSLNARLLTPPTSMTAFANSSVLVNKDPQHIRPVLNSVTSISSNASHITSVADSSGTSSSTGLTAIAVTDSLSSTASTGFITTAVTDTPSGPPSLSFNNTVTTTNNNNKGEMTDDGEPLYDSVASEDDYSYVEQMQKLAQQKQILEEQRRQHQLDAHVSINRS